MECIVCAYEIDCTERYPTIGACGHAGLCSLCSLKIRALQRNMACITCKRELEHVICSNRPDAKFEDFPMWGESIGPEFVLDQKSQMFFPNDYYKNKVQKLWVFKCTVCSRVFRDVKALKSHVNAEHNMQICMHCVENKHDFPAEQKIYTQKQYDTHLREGDQDGSLGHPNCEFCKKRFYDTTALFMHLNKEHYTCHLCEKIGIKFKYYKDYKHLEDHFRSAHILCDDPGCLARKFVVFDNEIDMEVHNRKYHPTFTVRRATTIKLDFKPARVASSNRTAASGGDVDDGGGKMDGSGGADESRERSGHVRYEGGLGGRERNGEWQVELQPTSAADPRDPNRNTHAAADAAAPPTRSTDAFSEDFPTLQGTTTSASASAGGAITLTNKWVSLGTHSGAGRKGKKNDFPALQSKKPPTAGSGLNSGGVQAGSTLSAIQKEYAGLANEPPPSSFSSRANPTGGLGDWARIRTDKKLGNKSTATKAGQEPAPVSGAGASFEDSLAIALAESLSDAYRAAPLPVPAAPPAAPMRMEPTSEPANVAPPAPPSVPAAIRYSAAQINDQDAYPALSAPVAPAAQPASAPKKKVNKSTAPGGWSEALSAVGMAGAGGTGKAAKKKLTVIKASGSNTSLNNMVTQEGTSAAGAAPVSGEKATASGPPGLSWENLKPIGKKSTDVEEWRAGATSTTTAAPATAPARSSVSTTTANSTTTAGEGKQYGGWAKPKVGGTGKEHGGGATAVGNTTAPAASAGPYRSLQDFPTLGGPK